MIQDNRDVDSSDAWPVHRPTMLGNVRGLVARHARKFTGCFLVVMLAAVAWTSFSTRTYRSEGKLYVRAGRENAALDVTTTMGQSQQLNVPQSHETEINSIVEALRSRTLLEKVVDAIGPEVVLDRKGRLPSMEADTAAIDDGPGLLSGVAERVSSALAAVNLTTPLTARERAVRELSESVGINPVRKSDVIVVDCSARSPQLAQAITAKLIDGYLQQHSEINRTPGARNFFTEQTELLRAAVTNSEERLRDLKTATGLASPDEQKHLLVTHMGRLEDELYDIQARVLAGEAEVQALRDKLAGLPRSMVTAETAGFGNEGTDGMRKEMYALQLRLQEMVAKYTDDHPLVMQIRTQAAAAKDILSQEARTRQQVTTSPNPSYQQVQLALNAQEPALAAQRAKAQALESQFATVRGELKTLNENTLLIASLERECTLQDASYRKYAENLEQSRVAEALDVQRFSNLRVLEPATLDLKPVLPKVPINLGLGLILGLMAGLAAALASELRSHRSRAPHDLEQTLGVPVLGSIPRWTHAPAPVHRRSH